MTEKEKDNLTQQAREAAEAQRENRPEYRSGREAQMAALMDRILNREDFRYDLNGDALFRQYRDRAVRDGQRAMQDTMGQAAALTGGYGNSYAQSAGQQAYSRQLEGLGDRIPELYALALDQYRQQTQGLQQRYELLAGAERQDYDRYLDALSAWQREADSLWDIYRDSRDFDYDRYRDSIGDRQWLADYEESRRRYDQEWERKNPMSHWEYLYTGAAQRPEPDRKPSAIDSLTEDIMGRVTKEKQNTKNH